MCPCGFGCGLSWLFGRNEKQEVTREVIREVVMIPCKYCGALFQQTETFCPHCGARRTA